MVLTATAIRDALAARQIGLSGPATEHDLQQFEAGMNLSLNAHVRDLYRAFNGFWSVDERSQIRLWPLQELAKNRELCLELGEQRYFTVGTF